MATAEETARLLANTEVFAGLEQRELEEVAMVAVPRRWDRGEILFREGDTGDTCYLMRDGAVLLTREHQDGRLVALAEFRAGDLFGELAMFRGETSLAEAPEQVFASVPSTVPRTAVPDGSDTTQPATTPPATTAAPSGVPAENTFGIVPPRDVDC